MGEREKIGNYRNFSQGVYPLLFTPLNPIGKEINGTTRNIKGLQCFNAEIIKHDTLIG